MIFFLSSVSEAAATEFQVGSVMTSVSTLSVKQAA